MAIWNPQLLGSVTSRYPQLRQAPSLPDDLLAAALKSVTIQMLLWLGYKRIQTYRIFLLAL